MNHRHIESDDYGVKNEMIVFVVYLNHAGVHVATVSAVTVVAVITVPHLTAVHSIALAAALFGLDAGVDSLVETAVTVEVVSAVVAAVNDVVDECGLTAVSFLAVAAVALFLGANLSHPSSSGCFSLLFFVVVSLQIEHILRDLYLCHCFAGCHIAIG